MTFTELLSNTYITRFEVFNRNKLEDEQCFEITLDAKCGHDKSILIIILFRSNRTR